MRLGRRGLAPAWIAAACAAAAGWGLGLDMGPGAAMALSATAVWGAWCGGSAGIGLAILAQARPPLAPQSRADLRRRFARAMASALGLVLASMAGLLPEAGPGRPLTAAWLLALALCCSCQLALLGAMLREPAPGPAARPGKGST